MWLWRGQRADSPAVHSERSQNGRTFESEYDMPELSLFVGGMSCRRCVREVTARLRDVPGVETVSANPGDRRVIVSGSMQLADVLAVFTGTTYVPQLGRTSGDERDGTATRRVRPADVHLHSLVYGSEKRHKERLRGSVL